MPKNSNCIICGFYLNIEPSLMYKAIQDGVLVKYILDGYEEFIHGECKEHINKIKQGLFTYSLMNSRRKKLISIFGDNYDLKNKLVKLNKDILYLRVKYKLEDFELQFCDKIPKDLDDMLTERFEIHETLNYNKKLATKKINEIFILKKSHEKDNNGNYLDINLFKLNAKEAKPVEDDDEIPVKKPLKKPVSNKVQIKYNYFANKK